MADAIESYVIQIGIDQKATLEALKKLQASLGNVTKTAQGGGKQLATLQDKAKGLGQTIEGLLLPLASLFGLGKVWNTFAEGGRQLQHFSEISDISAHKLDMWAQANEAAGGSYEAFIQGVVALKQKFRMSDEQIFGLGKALQGMDKLTQIQYLRTLGLSPEAAKVFMQKGAGAEQYAQRFSGTAMSDSEAKAAREASNQWRQVEQSAKRLGNTIALTVLPFVQKIFDWLYKTSREIEKNEIAVKSLVSMLALPVAIKGLTTLWGLATSLFGAFVRLKDVVLVLFSALRFHPVIAALTVFLSLLTVIINQFGGWGAALDRLVAKWKEFKADLAKFSFEPIGKAFDLIAQGLKDSILEALAFVADMFKGIFSFGAKADAGAGANTGLAGNVVTTNNTRTQSNNVSVQTTNNITVNGNADPKAVAQATQQGTDRSLSRATLSTLTSSR